MGADSRGRVVGPWRCDRGTGKVSLDAKVGVMLCVVWYGMITCSASEVGCRMCCSVSAPTRWLPGTSEIR